MSASRSTRSTRLTVLVLPNLDRSTGNPYLGLLIGALQRKGVQVLPLSLRAAVTQRADVVHVHWPEASLGVQRPRVALLRVLRLFVMLSVTRLRGTPVVWTVHNLRSHERPHPRLERVFWWLFPHLVSRWISLTPAGVKQVHETLPVLVRRPVWITRHGHYRESYAHAPESAPPSSSQPLLLHVGQIRAYKNVPALIASFRASRTSARLAVAGACHPPSLAAEIITAAGDDDRIDLRLTRVDDSELSTLLARARLVVLPYRETFNSGTALLALSFDRPVLLPRTPVYEELRREIGSQWVHLYDGDISVDVLDHAISLVAQESSSFSAPALGTDYDWDRIAEATLHAYRGTRAGPS